MKVTFKGKPLITSKYLEAEDLMGKRVPVIIESVHERAKLKRDTGDEDNKPLFRLRGKEKGWVLNTTNLESIAEVYGHEADGWVGKTVVIYATRVRAFGETKLAIRVDIDATQARAEAAEKQATQKPAPKQRTEAERAASTYGQEEIAAPDTGEVDSDKYAAEQQEAARAEFEGASAE